MQNTLDWLRASDSDYVKVGITDLDGIFRTKYLAKAKVAASLEDGFGFCNVIFGWDATDTVYGNATADGSFGDAAARYVPGSGRSIPWEDGLPLLLADFQGADGPAAACPRSLLARIVQRAADMGFQARFGPEYEWFTYRETPTSLAQKDYRDPEPLTPGMFGYSGLRTGQNAAYMSDLFGQLNAFGLELEGLHTETGPGVLEGALVHQETMEAADRAMLFKQGVKEISYRNGLLSSFMAKPSVDLPGCGGHLHQSLWQDGSNAFYAADQPNGMSEIFRQYLAGQLALLPVLMPLFAPNVNSYKRYVAGSWAATRANWGIDNRTVALRAIPSGPKATRLETRVPGADANPYLAIAAALAAGLYGIENRLELKDPPVQGSAYDQSVGVPLPISLGAAAGAMRDDERPAGILGEYFTDHFLRTREWEWSQFQRTVTNWERRRYFELA